MRKFLPAGFGLFSLVALLLALACGGCNMGPREGGGVTETWGPALAERVPDDALVYAGWQGTDRLKAQYDQSRMKAVMDASTMRKFFRESLPKILDRAQAAAGGEQVAVVKDLLEVGELMCKYPTVLYVGPVGLKADGPPQARVALACVAGADAEAMEKRIRGLLDKAGEPNGPLPADVKRDGATVVVTLGTLPAETMAMLTGHGGEKNLASDQGFAAALGQVRKGAALTCVVNVPAIVKNVNEGVAKFNKEDEPQWQRIRTALNLDGIGYVVLSAGFDGRDWMSQGFVALKGPRTGLAMLLDQKPVAEETLKVVPVDATFAAAGRFDVNKAFNEAMEVAGKIDAPTKESIQSGLGSVNQMIGADLQKEVLPALGDEWVVYSAPTVGGSGMMGLTVVNALKNPEVLKKTIDTVEKTATTMLDARPRQPFEPSFAPQRAMVGGMEVHYENLVMVSPSWVVKDGKLVLALTPQVVPSAFDQMGPGHQSILDNEAFVALRRRLGVPSASSIQFIDLPRTAPESYGTIAMLVGLANLFAGPEAEPGMLPPLSRLLPELTPAGSASWTDEAGWHMKAISPFPGAEMFGGQQLGSMGAAYPAMMVAILVPSLGRARELAQRTADAENIKAMEMGCLEYSQDKGDRMPESLAELVAEGWVPPKLLVAPWSGMPPLVIADAEQKKITAAGDNGWKLIEKEVDAHCNYVYLGKGTKSSLDASSRVLMYDKPMAGRREGMNVGFYDGHVEWIARDFPEVFRATNEMRRAAGLKEVTFDGQGWPVYAPATGEK